jgi:hypothetical protein
MTNASGAGVLLRYTFDDSFSIHVRLAELFTAEMRLLLERMQDLHGPILSIGEPRRRQQTPLRKSREIKTLAEWSALEGGNTDEN